MILLTREQCRAARGLLNWTQQDLASHCGLSKTSINNFERGLGNSKTDTLNRIHKTLIQEGITLLPHDGIQRHKTSLLMERGQGALDRLFDDIINHIDPKLDQVTLCLDDKDLFKKGIQRLHKQKVKTEIYDTTPYRIPGLCTICYGFKLGFYYSEDRVAMMIESPYAQRCELNRLRRLSQQEKDK